MKIYFAGSIRGGRDDKELYAQIIKLLSEYGTVLTEHIGSNTLSHLGENDPSDEFIYKRDVQWLTEADVIVAEVTSPSLGVGYEIGKMEDKKKVLCLYRPADNRRLSAMLGGNPNLTKKEYQAFENLKPIFDDFFAAR